LRRQSACMINIAGDFRTRPSALGLEWSQSQPSISVFFATESGHSIRLAPHLANAPPRRQAAPLRADRLSHSRSVSTSARRQCHHAREARRHAWRTRLMRLRLGPNDMTFSGGESFACSSADTVIRFRLASSSLFLLSSDIGQLTKIKLSNGRQGKPITTEAQFGYDRHRLKDYLGKTINSYEQLAKQGDGSSE
jgi:hypothetical protein